MLPLCLKRLFIERLPLCLKTGSPCVYALTVSLAVHWAAVVLTPPQAVPLHATAVTVPFLVVVLRVLRDTSEKHPVRLSAQDAANKIFEAMFSQVRLATLDTILITFAHHICTTHQPTIHQVYQLWTYACCL